MILICEQCGGLGAENTAHNGRVIFYCHQCGNEEEILRYSPNPHALDSSDNTQNANFHQTHEAISAGVLHTNEFTLREGTKCTQLSTSRLGFVNHATQKQVQVRLNATHNKAKELITMSHKKFWEDFTTKVQLFIGMKCTQLTTGKMGTVCKITTANVEVSFNETRVWGKFEQFALSKQAFWQEFTAKT